MTEADLDYEIAQMMRTYGGSFVKKLAECFLSADGINRVRVKGAFPDYWQAYRQMAEKERATTAIQQAEDPDGSAAVAKMAYIVGYKMGVKDAEKDADEE